MAKKPPKMAEDDTKVFFFFAVAAETAPRIMGHSSIRLAQEASTS